MPAKGARAGYKRLGPLTLARFHTRQHYSVALEMLIVFTFLWWYRVEFSEYSGRIEIGGFQITMLRRSAQYLT